MKKIMTIKAIKTITILAIILLFIATYKGYWKQRKDFEKNLSWPLQLACHKIVQDEFGQHASDIHTKNVGYHDAHKTTGAFNIYNNLYYLNIRSSSTIYFHDYAPQDLYCVAMIAPRGATINKNTKVKFSFYLPTYLPLKDEQRSYVLKDRELTFRQVENLTSVKFNLFYANPLEKPGLLYEIFSFFY